MFLPHIYSIANSATPSPFSHPLFTRGVRGTRILRTSPSHNSLKFSRRASGSARKLSLCHNVCPSSPVCRVCKIPTQHHSISLAPGSYSPKCVEVKISEVRIAPVQLLWSSQPSLTATFILKTLLRGLCKSCRVLP